MRRKDREILDSEKINQIIESCHCCRLGFTDNGKVYIVPLNFGFTYENGHRTFYFHSAKEGRKINLIKATPSVGFELDTNYELHPGEIACDYSAGFQSVIGTGTVSIIENPVEKKKALQSLMYHNTRKEDWDFNDKMLNAVTVFQLKVEEISCKEHL